MTPECSLDRYDGIILSSKQGVAALEAGYDGWQRLPALCVGAATARAVERHGGTVLGVANGYGEGIPALMDAQRRGMRWLYARPAVIASDFAEKLRQAGVVIDEAVVYETRCAETAPETQITVDAVLIFTSPSAVACFLRRFAIGAQHDIIAIGKTTQNALNGYHALVAPEPTLEACITLAQSIAKEPQPC